MGPNSRQQWNLTEKDGKRAHTTSHHAASHSFVIHPNNNTPCNMLHIIHFRKRRFFGKEWSKK